MDNLVDWIKEVRRVDVSVFDSGWIEKCLNKRIEALNCKDKTDYAEYIKQHPTEIDNILKHLTIKYSLFFRNRLAWEYLRRFAMPNLIDNARSRGSGLRFWSAGCAEGEEPYTLALILAGMYHDRLPEVSIFASDIDRSALETAKVGAYRADTLKQMPMGLAKDYFERKGDTFKLNQQIVDMVSFSFHDLTGIKTRVPADSIYGGFDLIMCRNVLMYFKGDVQNKVVNGFYKALRPNGYLAIGRAESITGPLESKFDRLNECCNLYIKRG